MESTGGVSLAIKPKGGLSKTHKWDYPRAMSETLYFVIRNLNEARGRWDCVERESGVSRRTFEKIVQGATRNPRIETVEKLAAYFRANNNSNSAEHAAA